MRFPLHLSIRLFIWALVFGFISGIFGVSVALINIADFYLQEGTNQSANTYTYKVLSSESKALTDDILTELQNIQGVGFVDPYFSPTNEIIGKIEYFGFSASYPIQIQGIPKRLGQAQTDPTYRSSWDSADLSTLPVLLPKQAITLYNSLAPQRSWPTLPEDSFLGLPGTRLNFGTNSVQAIISGFDAEEFGMIVKAPAEKLYAIFSSIALSPNYDYIIIETVPGLTKKQARDTTEEIAQKGFRLSSTQEESIQQGLFIRIKYTIMIFGFSILIAFILLLHYDIRIFLQKITKKILLYRLWAIKDHTVIQSIFITMIFSVLAGLISWIICFFAVVPAQEYMTVTLSNFGFNTPSLRDTIDISFDIAFVNTALFMSIPILTVIYFYFQTRFPFKNPFLSKNNFHKKPKKH